MEVRLPVFLYFIAHHTVYLFVEFGFPDRWAFIECNCRVDCLFGFKRAKTLFFEEFVLFFQNLFRSFLHTLEFTHRLVDKTIKKTLWDFC